MTARQQPSSKAKPLPVAVDDDTGSDTETWDTGDEWEVEQVIGKQLDENGRLSYHLKWKNWDGEPTWEPKANCRCDRLIEEYERKLDKSSRASGRKTSDSSSSNRSASIDTSSPTPSTSMGPARFKKTPKRGLRI